MLSSEALNIFASWAEKRLFGLKISEFVLVFIFSHEIFNFFQRFSKINFPPNTPIEPVIVVGSAII